MVQFGNFRNFVFFSDPKAIKPIFALSSSQADVGRANWILKPTVGENPILLLEILRNYDLALAETRPVIPMGRGVAIAPKGGFHMVIVEQRSHQHHHYDP
jgi:hypothetical protein